MGQAVCLPRKGNVMTREEYFCKEFVEKIYYFCLKKTSNVQEAQDLSSEIAVEVLTALGKGTIPEHFEGWVWTITRNRYAKWADRKHKRSKNEGGEEEALLQIPGGENPQGFLRPEEELSLMLGVYMVVD